MNKPFLPLSRQEAHERGWSELDFIFVSGDAYVDHPSFAAAMIGRYLEAHGFRVGIIAQPDWRNSASFAAMGKPRLAFLIGAGNLDSMVNHYTVARKRRKYDAYSPGGATGRRPDRAILVYSRIIRELFPDTPQVIGGIEVGLRRLAHYDYWNNRLMPSLLLASEADLLVYGMGEKTALEIAEALQSGLSIADITYVRGTVFRAGKIDRPQDTVVLPSYESMCRYKEKFAESFAIQEKSTDPFSAPVLAEPYEGQGYIMQNPPPEPLTTEEMDMIYRLPFNRAAHPSYDSAGGVPALSEVKFSLIVSRGCFGGCSFCSLHFHQGRIVQSRSDEAVVEEAVALTDDPDFKGYIHDVGGPTANFHQKACRRQENHGACPDRQCLFPEPCPELKVDHSRYLQLLRSLRQIEGVKKVFIRSGLRHDYLLLDRDAQFFEELCEHHISGQLKVAPEHASAKVLAMMRKPGREVYLAFKKKFRKINKKLGKEQFLVPYYISSHPGSDLESAVELAAFIRKHEHRLEQVQDFYPTPGTLSTCMFYSGLDPHTMEPVYIPKSPHEKAMQRALMQFNHPGNYRLVREALHKTGRSDLIGYGRHCLIKPRPDGGKKKSGKTGPAQRRT